MILNIAFKFGVILIMVGLFALFGSNIAKACDYDEIETIEINGNAL